MKEEVEKKNKVKILGSEPMNKMRSQEYFGN